jgi:hypothetical protein
MAIDMSNQEKTVRSFFRYSPIGVPFDWNDPGAVCVYGMVALFPQDRIYRILRIGFGRTRRPAPVGVRRRLKPFSSPQTHADQHEKVQSRDWAFYEVNIKGGRPGHFGCASTPFREPRADLFL